MSLVSCGLRTGTQTAHVRTRVTLRVWLQVNLPKPIGVRFGRGNDGGAYVIKSEEALGNTDERIAVRPSSPPLRACLFSHCSVWTVVE